MPSRFFPSSLRCELGFINAKDSLSEGQFNFLMHPQTVKISIFLLSSSMIELLGGSWVKSVLEILSITMFPSPSTK